MDKVMHRLSIVIFAVVIMYAGSVSDAFAVGSAGFENASFSARTRARGNAAVADGSGPDTIMFNPAGLADVQGNQVDLGSTFLVLSTEYTGNGGRLDEESSETLIPVPYFYTSIETPVEDLTLGVGMNAPFGSITKYNSDGAFKYIAYYTNLTVKGYHVSAGYRLNPMWSIGGGFTYLDATLKQNGKFNQGFLGVPGDPDAPFELDVAGHGYGYNLGVMYKPDDRNTLGLYYRSEVRVNMGGEFATDNLSSLAGTFGTGSSNLTSAKTFYTFPANITLGFKHEVNDALDVEFDLGWTDWSSYDITNITFGTSNAVLVGFEKLDRDYNDSLSFHLGASMDLNETTELSGGYIYYQMAANTETYTNENPDGNRHGMSLGIHKSYGNWSGDLSYTLVLYEQVDIANLKGSTNGTVINGKYDSIAQIAGLSLKFDF